MTREIPMTIPEGTFTPTEPIGVESRGGLLDVAQPLKTLLYDFLRRVPALAGRKHLIYFLFQSMHDKFVDCRVAARGGTLFHFIEQFAFQLHLVRAEHNPRSLDL